MMNRESIRQHLLQIGILHGGHFLPQNFLGGAALPYEQRKLIPLHGQIPQRLGGLARLCAGMREDEHLIPALALPHRLLVADFVLELESSKSVAFGDSQILHLERHGTVRVIEEEHAFFGIDAQKGGDVGVVGQCGGEAHESDGLRGRFHLSDNACDNALQHGATIVVQQVNLVDNHQLHQLGVRPSLSLARDNVPFFGGRHDHLRFRDLLPRQAGIAR
mmetsp:Transcript_43794/g.78592  ORF Transcript_43794/g.78592 Transcript_43794/m.78592 type:complete len:219 (-) Transcript_43794:236-892(-)